VGIEVEATPRLSWTLVPAFGVSFSAFLLFGLQHEPSGYAVLVVSVILGFIVDRELGKSLLLIGFGIGIIGTISLAADISYGHIALMGSVLLIAVVVPYVVDRFVFKRHIVRFPINTGRKWTTGEKWYLASVVGLAWVIMPFYFIRSGTYLNWPAVSEPSEIIRLFICVNAVGLWDELFFICTAFALLRRHFRMWQANILQAIIFVSFLWELGYQSWGPFLTTPFALIQGYIFNRTRSLPYVVSVHLIFDCVLWAILLHAHNPGWLPIFFY
jgi:membrane protease YdiL (CAAX protease family)